MNREHIDLKARFVLREVMDKGGVNHAIEHGCSIAQAFQVFKIASMHLGSGNKLSRHSSIVKNPPKSFSSTW
jgi:hypothetical protein